MFSYPSLSDIPFAQFRRKKGSRAALRACSHSRPTRRGPQSRVRTVGNGILNPHDADEGTRRLFARSPESRIRTFRRPRHALSAPAASPVKPDPSTAASAVIPAKSRFSKCNGNSFRYLSQKRRFHPVPPEIRVLLPLEFESWRIKQNIVSCFVKSSRIFTLITPLKPAPHSILTLYAQNEKKDEEYGDPVKSAQAACPQLHTAICTWRVEMSRHDSTGAFAGMRRRQDGYFFIRK